MVTIRYNDPPGSRERHLKTLALKWRACGCADRTIGVLLRDENDARANPLPALDVLHILRSVFERGIA